LTFWFSFLYPDDQYEYQYKSASGEISSLPFDNVDDDLIEVADGESTFTLKRSMVYDYRKQANYYGALKVKISLSI